MNSEHQIFAAVVTCLIVVAAQGSEPSPERPPLVQATDSAESTCFSTLASGSDEGSFSTCITADGNVKSFRVGFNEQISEGLNIEGYSICRVNSPTINYDGADAGESGWLDPTINQPGGVNTFPFTIERTSTDGALLLTQTFYVAPSRQTVIVSMALRNLSAQDMTSVSLSRFVNPDVDGLATLNDAHTSRNGITVWRNPSGGQLQLSNTSTRLPSRSSLGQVNEAFAGHGCEPYFLQSPVTSGTDVAGKVTVFFSRIRPGVTRRVNFMYTGH